MRLGVFWTSCLETPPCLQKVIPSKKDGEETNVLLNNRTTFLTLVTATSFHSRGMSWLWQPALLKSWILFYFTTPWKMDEFFLHQSSNFWWISSALFFLSLSLSYDHKRKKIYPWPVVAVVILSDPAAFALSTILITSNQKVPVVAFWGVWGSRSSQPSAALMLVWHQERGVNNWIDSK